MHIAIRRAITTRTTLPLLGVSILSPSRLLSTLALTASRHPEPKPNPAKPLSKPEFKTLVLACCRHGKFYNILQNVVASPSVLLTACNNLKAPQQNNASTSAEFLSLDSVSTHFFCLQELAAQLSQNKFDLESFCFTMPASTQKGSCFLQIALIFELPPIGFCRRFAFPPRRWNEVDMQGSFLRQVSGYRLRCLPNHLAGFPFLFWWIFNCCWSPTVVALDKENLLVSFTLF